MKGDTGISCVNWNSRIWLVPHINLKLLRLDARSAIAVAYQTISTSLAGRPLDKPHNGRSLRRSRLRHEQRAEGSLVNKPTQHNILWQRWD